MRPGSGATPPIAQAEPGMPSSEVPAVTDKVSLLRRTRKALYDASAESETFGSRSASSFPRSASSFPRSSSAFPRCQTSLAAILSFDLSADAQEECKYSFDDGQDTPAGITPPQLEGRWLSVCTDGDCAHVFTQRVADPKVQGYMRLWLYNRSQITYLVHCPIAVGRSAAGCADSFEGKVQTLLHSGASMHFVSEKEGAEPAELTVERIDTRLPPNPQYRRYLTEHEKVAKARLQREMQTIEHHARREHLDPTLRENQREVVNMCIRLRIPYVDMSFKPERKTLGLQNAPDSWEGWAWLRPRQFLAAGTKAVLFLKEAGARDCISPDDIDQGRSGDCYFLSALACVACFPDLIRRIFMRNEYNSLEERKVGAWSMRLCKDGWWREVIVDECIPCDGVKPVFGSNKEFKNELWVALIEKGFAKCCGSYKAIEKPPGDPVEAFADMTGYTYERWPTWWREARGGDPDREDFFGDLEHAIGAGCGLVIYTWDREPPGMPRGSQRKVGLVAGHSYTLLNVVEVELDDGRPEQLLRIRNPHGDAREWNGDWSDSSPLWNENPELEERLEHTCKEDGAFWISWRDARKWFESGGTLHLAKNWVALRMRTSWEQLRPQHVLEVSCHDTAMTTICLHQQDRRITGRDGYTALMICVVRPVPGGLWDVAPFNDEVNRDGGKSMPSEDGKGQYSRNRDCVMDYVFEPTEDGRPYYILWSAHPDPQVDTSYGHLRSLETMSHPIVVALHADRKFATVRVRDAGDYGHFFRDMGSSQRPYVPGALRTAPMQWGWNQLRVDESGVDMRSMPDPQQPFEGSCEPDE
eukprot:TRINITY_DN3597_c0_g2_i1.p1 TRINITY_DN3597_c0_g2~~TRINITY_DN3597_c0_g2_i1.p1  ORF type:complete len:812 (+),score=254.33 TRINITY_DN3597_c0_g2_i1:1275-3710(+)